MGAEERSIRTIKVMGAIYKLSEKDCKKLKEGLNETNIDCFKIRSPIY